MSLRQRVFKPSAAFSKLTLQASVGHRHHSPLERHAAALQGRRLAVLNVLKLSASSHLRHLSVATIILLRSGSRRTATGLQNLCYVCVFIYVEGCMYVITYVERDIVYCYWYRKNLMTCNIDVERAIVIGIGRI